MSRLITGRRSVTDAKSGGRTDLRLACNRPKKADHLPRDCGRHNDLRLACRREPAIAGTQPDLRFPGDVADDLWKSLEPVVQLAADAGLHSIGPSSFDQDTPCKRVACLGDAAAAYRRPA